MAERVATTSKIVGAKLQEASRCVSTRVVERTHNAHISQFYLASMPYDGLKGAYL